MRQLVKYKADEELLRLVFLEGFGYSLAELAKMLQTSESFMKKMKASLANNDLDALPINKSTNKFGIEDRRIKRSDNFLRYFFMNIREKDGTNSQKKFERCYAILSLLHEKSATHKEIEEMLTPAESADDENNDKKAVARPSAYIKLLKDEGLIELKDKKYHLVTPFFKKVDAEQLYRLLAFCLEMMSKTPISYHGEQVYEAILDFLTIEEGFQFEDSPLIVQGTNFLRILDEHKIMELQKAIREKRYISYLYLTSDKPRVVKQDDINAMDKKVFLPIKVVYDHAYGRWYVIGRDNKKKVLKEDVSFSVKKVDLISNMELLEEQMSEDVFGYYERKVESKLQNSWLVSQANTIEEVRLKFFIQNPKILKRLEQEKRWGIIEKSTVDSVEYTINVRDYNEMRPWIRSFGQYVQVIKPARLVEEMEKELEARLARYSDV